MIEIIDMKESDIAAVTSLEKEVFSVPWTAEGFSDTIAMENVCFLLAKEDGALLGYCGLYMAMDEGDITNVAVSSRSRRKGVGSLLIEAILAAGRKNSVFRFFLEVRISNEPAIRLYEKYGFIKCGVRKGFYEKPKEDAFVMCREFE